MTQYGSWMTPKWPFMALDGPKTTQEGTKSPPKTSQTPHFGSIFPQIPVLVPLWLQNAPPDPNSGFHHRPLATEILPNAFLERGVAVAPALRTQSAAPLRALGVLNVSLAYKGLINKAFRPSAASREPPPATFSVYFGLLFGFTNLLQILMPKRCPNGAPKEAKIEPKCLPKSLQNPIPKKVAKICSSSSSREALDLQNITFP